jgi:hypothetical protein
MATTRLSNNQVPLVVGGQYLLTPGIASNDWIVITGLGSKNIIATGIENNKADFTIPRTKFDDLVVEYIIDGVSYSRFDGVYQLVTDRGSLLVF